MAWSSTDAVSFSRENMRLEKRRVALNSVLAAGVITALKFFVGISTFSLGILSEAAHSTLDFIAAVITLMSVRVSDKPADADHQYGHGKVENFSAFLETGLLLLTCIWIVWEAIQRMFYRHVHIEATALAYIVLILSIAVDYWRSRALRRIADKYDSQALAADALHFSTDVWSTTVVLLGLALVQLGRRFSIPWLSDADPVAALFVAGVVVYVSWRLARQTVDALLDAAPGWARSRILSEVTRVPGVLEVGRVRTRRAGNRYFADLSIGLARNVTFQRSEQISKEVSDAVRRVLPDADVIVHSQPTAGRTENIFDRVRAVAARNNLSVHDVSVQDLGGRLTVEQHLELPENLSLKEAHEVVTRIEAEMRGDVPELTSILTHIESEPGTIETADEVIRDQRIQGKLRGIAAEFPQVLDLHDVSARRIGGRLYLSCHCTMPDEMALSQVHDIATALETRIKQASPEVFKVLIHPEPQTDNRR